MATVSEFDVIRHYFARPQREGILGAGDDCALLPATPGAWAISTDLLLEGRHFFSDVDPAALGHKSLAVNLSDLAAMGATPRGFVLGLGLPAIDTTWLAAFSSGLHALADAYQCPLIGGDTTRSSSGVTIAITVFGAVDARRALRRDAARPGDDIWVSGGLGEADIALRLMQAQRSTLQSVGVDRQGATDSGPRGHAVPPGSIATDAQINTWLQHLPANQVTGLLAQTRQRLERPHPRVTLGQQLSGLAHAAIDISDGLMQDLGHVLAASNCGAVIFAPCLPLAESLVNLPSAYALRAALGGGDAYELCFTADPARRNALVRLSARLQLPLTRIGSITAEAGVTVQDAEGRTLSNVPGGFDHFVTTTA